MPSPGIQTAPARSSVRRIGAIRPASAGDTNSNSMPKLFARAICRFISVSRSGVFATLRLPHCFQPVASPVSRFQRRVELDAVAAHPRRVARRARLADESRRVPGRAAGEPALLEQDDVAHAELREVVGSRHAGDAAADDDDARVGGEAGSCHGPDRRPLPAGTGFGRSGGQSFSAATPATTLAAPASRGSPKPSCSHTAPISAAKSTDVSRSAATAATGRRGHRPQHDAVGGEAGGAADEAAPPAAPQVRDRGPSPPQADPAEERNRFEEGEPRDVAQRRCPTPARRRRRSACRRR